MVTLNYVIGVNTDSATKQTVYKVLTAMHNPKESVANKAWAFKGNIIAENVLADYIKRGGAFCNATLKDGKVVGLTGAFDRFEDGTCVIVSEIRNENDERIGYRVVNNMCRVIAMPMETITKHCKKMDSEGKVPFQNAIYKGLSSKGIATISTYPNSNFYVEHFNINVAKRTQNTAPAKTDMTANNANMQNKTSVFNQKQLAILRGLQNKGINPSVIANPKLSVAQMEVLADGLQHKVNVKAFASPEFTATAMAFIILNMMKRRDVTPLLNPKYSDEQLYEINCGLVTGIDVSSYADPKISAEEMAQIRLRVTDSTWTSTSVQLSEDGGLFVKKSAKKKSTKKSKKKKK